MKNLKIATAVMSGRIYAGKVNKAGNAFLDGKIDVTGDCVNAVCEHAIGKGGVITLTANGIEIYEVTVRKLNE